jgi:hypothetical protein
MTQRCLNQRALSYWLPLPPEPRDVAPPVVDGADRGSNAGYSAMPLARDVRRIARSRRAGSYNQHG